MCIRYRYYGNKFLSISQDVISLLANNFEVKNNRSNTFSSSQGCCSYFKCWNRPYFASHISEVAPHGKSYYPYTGKPPQAVSSPVLSPNFCTFGNGGKDSAGRTPPPPGSSAYRDGRNPVSYTHLLCRPLYESLRYTIEANPKCSEYANDVWDS